MGADLDAYRRFFAEDLQICANLRTPALVEALAVVPRERFLPPGPWVVRGEADVQSPLRHTPGDDPRFVYHNIAVGLDPGRMLFNGAPGVVASAIDALALAPGRHVVHVGTGTGYYTALLAQIVGEGGRVTGIEVDEALARQAAAYLADWPWAEARHGDGRGPFGDRVDAMLVSGGVTHPEPEWLSALSPGGSIVLPLTAAFAMPGPAAAALPAMASISKGLLVLLTRGDRSDHFDARVVTFIAIYSAVGLRDEGINVDLGRALSRLPLPPLRAYRLDAHDADATCWCHTTRGCWSTRP